MITAGQGGFPAGLVSNSFASVSLDPPLVSWCVSRDSTSLDTWLGAEGFAVHILGAEESPTVSRLTRRGGDKFTGLDWTSGVTGAPLLPLGVACLECRTWQQYDGGDHVNRIVSPHLDLVRVWVAGGMVTPRCRLLWDELRIRAL